MKPTPGLIRELNTSLPVVQKLWRSTASSFRHLAIEGQKPDPKSHPARPPLPTEGNACPTRPKELHRRPSLIGLWL